MSTTSRIVLITGATGHLGEAVAKVFLAAGDTVVLSGRNRLRLNELQASLRPLDRVDIAISDPSQEDGAGALVRDVSERHGRIDCLVHLVGAFAFGSMIDAPASTWSDMFTSNVLSAAHVCKQVLPGMLERGYGKIAFMSSVATANPSAGTGPYAASKAALEAIAKATAQEVKGRGVNVNVAAITTLDTPEARKSMPNIDPWRFISPDDLALTLLFLCSDAARALNGAIVPVVGTATVEVKL